MNMTIDDHLSDLLRCYEDSPHPSFKVSSYFQVYADLFSHLRGRECTFIETGILNGGSLFMWKKWLGEKARIIGIDLNPNAKKWENFGFEIYIGDQGDPLFWQSIFGQIGSFDALVDDGGHQSFQQIVTLTEALKFAKKKCSIVIEDTCTSFLKEFSAHKEHSFLEYAKDSTDTLLASSSSFFANQFPTIHNEKIVSQFSSVYSIQFFAGIVAYKIDPVAQLQPKLIWNHTPKNKGEQDFRFSGVSSAVVDWPDLFSVASTVVEGGIA
jgi:hypothetical protein